jgi:hypothetical protein
LESGCKAPPRNNFEWQAPQCYCYAFYPRTHLILVRHEEILATPRSIAAAFGTGACTPKIAYANGASIWFGGDY